MLRCAQRGWDLLLAAAVPLLIGGVVWTGLNLFTAGLLAGPALVGLFTVAFKAHQGRRAEVADVFAAFDDPAAPLLAGLVFVTPFRLADFLGQGLGPPPIVVPVLLAAWFALGIHVFAVLADRPELGLRGAVRESWVLAEAGASAGRWSALARHVLYGTAAFVVIALGRSIPGIGGLSLVVTLPAAVCVLTAWHAHVAAPSEAAGLARPPAPPVESSGTGRGGAEDTAPKRKRTPSRRPADGGEKE